MKKITEKIPEQKHNRTCLKVCYTAQDNTCLPNDLDNMKQRKMKYHTVIVQCHQEELYRTIYRI